MICVNRRYSEEVTARGIERGCWCFKILEYSRVNNGELWGMVSYWCLRPVVLDEVDTGCSVPRENFQGVNKTRLIPELGQASQNPQVPLPYSLVVYEIETVANVHSSLTLIRLID